MSKKEKLTREQIKVKIREKKIRKAFKIARFRGFKNFMFWFTGAMMSFVIFFLAIFVGVGVVPIGTYTGSESDKYVSEDVSSKSIYQAIMSLSTFDFADFPIVEQSIKDLLATEISTDEETSEKTVLGDLISVDFAKLNEIKFEGDFSSKVTECLAFNKEGVKKVLGDDGKFEAFSNYTPVQKPDLDSEYNVGDVSTAKLYYYEDTSAVAGPVVKGFSANKVYKRAFDDQGVLVEELRDKYSNDELKLFYAPLFDFPITEALGYVSKYTELLPVTDILSFVGMDSSAVISQALKGVFVGDFMKDPEKGGFSVDSVLDNITLSSISQGDGVEFLGTLANLSVFSEYKLVEQKPQLDAQNVIIKVVKSTEESEDPEFETQEDFEYNPKLFYVMTIEPEGEALAQYARAFDDEGKLITHFYDENDELIYQIDNYATEKLYYANLTEVPIAQLISVALDRLSVEYVQDVLTQLEVTVEDFPIDKIVDGKTIGQLFELDFGELLNKISLSDFGVLDGLGSFGNLSFLSAFREVGPNDYPEIIDGIITKIDEQFTSNPKLYYYVLDEQALADSDKYARAFTDEGAFVAGVDENTKLYYANLSVVGVQDALSLIGESFMGEELISLLETFGMQVKSDSLIYKLFDGKKVGDLGELNFENVLNDLTINDLGATDALGLFGKLSSFTDWKPVGDNKPQIKDGAITKVDGEFTANPKLYYYVLDEQALNDADKYARAFTDEGAFVAGVDENTSLYYAKLSAVGFGTMLEILGDSIMIESATELFEQLGMKFDDNSLIKSIIGDKTVGELGNISTDELQMTKVLAFKTNVEAYKIILGALGKTWEEGKDETETLKNMEAVADALTLSSLSSLNPDCIALDLVMTLDETTAKILCQGVNGFRAQKALDDKTYVKPDDVTAKTITVGDMADFKPEYILLQTVMPSVDTDMQNILSDALNGKAFEAITVKDLSAGLSIDSVRLSTVLPLKKDGVDNSQLYKILLDAKNNYNPETFETDAKALKISDVSGVEFNNVHLSIVFENMTEGNDLYDILVDVLGDFEKITIGKINALEVEKIHLLTVLPLNENGVDNSPLYKILVDVVCGKYYEETFSEDVKKVTIDAIMGVDFHEVHLATVLDNLSSGNALFDILTDAFGDFEKVTIGDIGKLEIDKVHLSTVLNEMAEGDVLFDILTQAFGEFDSITISQLSSLSLNNVSLETVLPKKDKESGKEINKSLYAILDKTVTDANGDGKIQIGELGSFTPNKMCLSDVMPYSSDNSTLYKILIESAGKTWTADTLESLAGTLSISDIKFDVSKVKLETVIGNSDNVILSALIQKGISVGQIGSAIDGLSLYEVYGKNVFTETVIADAPKYTFNSESGTYTLDDNGKYYLNKDCGIWLLLCFTSSDDIYLVGDNAGRPYSYTISNSTIKDLQDGKDISKAFTNATVKMLIDAGVIDSANELLWTKRINEILNP